MKVEIKKSTNKNKKLMAIFYDGTKKKTIHFGAAGMSDYTIHNDGARLKRFSEHRYFSISSLFCLIFAILLSNFIALK